MIALLAFVLCTAQNDPIVIRTVESPTASFPALEVSGGEIGVALNVAPEMADLVTAAGFSTSPASRDGVTFVADPKAGGSGTVVWISSLPREQTAAALREAKGITLCIVTGRGGGDPEPLKIGDAWMVQAPGTSGMWGTISIQKGVVASAFRAPDGKPSDKVAAAKKKRGVPADPMGQLRAGVKAAGTADAPPAFEAANRACRMKIHSVTERTSYGPKTPPAGKKELVLDAEFENTIPMTLIQQNQVPTMYKIKDLGDHLYIVINGNRVARLYPDGASLPGHVATSGFTLDRLGARARGNLVYEIPSEGVKSIDLRFYDYSHGHMSVLLRPAELPEAKPLVPVQENDVLEAGIYRAERAKEVAGKAAPEGMTYLVVELRARSRMFTEGDATAFDPKAKPGDKLKIGTVSDWTDLRRHLNILVDGLRSYGSVDSPEIGESPRFIPDILCGGTAVFLVPEKVQSMEVRCDFPNARLPDGKVVHPKALSFLVEGKRPEPAAVSPILEIDDQIFKVAVTGQTVTPDFAGMKAPGGASFLVLDVLVTGAGTAGEVFQTTEQLHYTTEKGQQLPMHEATFKGMNAPGRLHLVPTGERRAFQVVFAMPAADRRPRLAYKGVTKAAIVDLRPLEGASPEPTPRSCPKCKAPAAPNEKFCGECGTKLNP